MRSSVVPSPRHTTRSDPSRPARKTESRTSRSPSPTRPSPAPMPSRAGGATANLPGEGPGRSGVPVPAGDGVGAGGGLVGGGGREVRGSGLPGEGEWEVLDSVFLAGREGSDRVVCRGLGTTEDRIDVGDLPIADRAIHRRSDLAPVEAGSVRGVDHALVFGGRAVLLEEPPDLVEETYGHLALPLPLRRGGFPRHGFPSAESDFWVGRVE